MKHGSRHDRREHQEIESRGSVSEKVAEVTIRHLYENAFAIKPKGFMGAFLFSQYRGAVSGLSTYEKCRRANIAPGANIATIGRKLSEAGFRPLYDDAAGALVAAADDIAKERVRRTAERLESTKVRLEASGQKLYLYQEAGVRYLSERRAALLADEMGLGKTAQALLAADPYQGVCVVCPPIARGVWQKEAANWRPDLRVSCLEGMGSFRWPSPGELVITGTATLPEPPGPDGAERSLPAHPITLIADEAHAFKTSKAKRTAAFRALSAATRGTGGNVWLLTATPLLNKPNELWSVLRVGGLELDAFGDWDTFLALFGGVKGRFGLQWGKGETSHDEAAERLSRVALRRTRAEVLPDLPGKTYQLHEVETAASALLDAADAKWLDDAPVPFEELSKARTVLAQAKTPGLAAFVEPYEEAEEPIVVFSDHRHPVLAMGKREGWRVITGETPPGDRAEIAELFQAGKLRGIAGTIDAMGTAITLTRANHVVFVDRKYTPALNWQAEDRLSRIGQKRAVVVHDLVSTHRLDRRLYEILVAKETLVNETIGETRGVAPEAGPAQIRTKSTLSSLTGPARRGPLSAGEQLLAAEVVRRFGARSDGYTDAEWSTVTRTYQK